MEVIGSFIKIKFQKYPVIDHHTGSQLSFRMGQSLNPCLPHYRKAFAFSGVPLPPARRCPLRDSYFPGGKMLKGLTCRTGCPNAAVPWMARSGQFLYPANSFCLRDCTQWASSTSTPEVLQPSYTISVLRKLTTVHLCYP